MWCAYAFAGLDIISLPDAIHAGTAAIVSWVAQTFLQLVLLSVIMVGQNIHGTAADKRAEHSYNDIDMMVHMLNQLTDHLNSHEQILTDITKAVHR